MSLSIRKAKHDLVAQKIRMFKLRSFITILSNDLVFKEKENKIFYALIGKFYEVNNDLRNARIFPINLFELYVYQLNLLGENIIN